MSSRSAAERVIAYGYPDDAVSVARAYISLLAMLSGSTLSKCDDQVRLTCGSSEEAVKLFEALEEWMEE